MAMHSSVKDPPKRQRSQPIILIGGDKGGVGKSFAARIIAAYLRNNRYSIVGFDGDKRNGHLTRFHEDNAEIIRSQLRDELGWSQMYVDWENASNESVILVDFPGNIGDMIEAEAERLKLVAAALGRSIINVWVASEEEDSIWLLPTALQVADERQTLFWLNGRFGRTRADFQLWNESKTRASFVANGGTEAFLPVLPIFARTKITRARCPFDDVSEARLGVSEQIDFVLWWGAVEKELQPLSRMLEVC